MILSFSRNWPWGEPTNFHSQIRTGDKCHTIRAGERWNPGDKIHHWINSPRTPAKNPHRFSVSFDQAAYWHVTHQDIPEGIYSADEMKALFPTQDVVPHEVAVPVVYATEPIAIDNHGNGMMIFVGDTREPHTLLIGKRLKQIITKDGFQSEKEMNRFFSANATKYHFKGQLIHWQEGNLYNEQTANILQL